MDARTPFNLESTAIQNRPSWNGHWGTPLNVAIEGVHKDFGVTPALNGVTLDIRGGELIALLGPSGSGKTTLLRILGGLDNPTSGRVLFGGDDALRLSVQERNVGFVFQHYALFRNMNVLDNVSFGLKVRPRALRPSSAEIRRRALELLDLVQLSGLEKRYPNQISGGQRQRVALARALAIEPRILLLDEPFGALDAKVRRELRRWLREIHDKTGHTTVFVTHDQEEALELADRVVVMNLGKIEQVGTPDDVYDKPASPFVFSFIGEASALPAQVAKGEVLFEGRAIGRADGAPDGGVTLFFRPQDTAEADPADGVTGIVRAVRRVGPDRRIEIETEAGRHVVEIDSPPGRSVSPNDAFAFVPTRFELFADGA
jgi:sulfate transport system ATP-binding protein